MNAAVAGREKRIAKCVCKTGGIKTPACKNAFILLHCKDMIPFGPPFHASADTGRMDSDLPEPEIC